MSNFDNLLDDLKSVTDEVGKKAGETLEISKLSLERARIRGRIQQNYRRLGEVIYGGYKNGEDVSDVVAVLYEQLDEDFERVEEIYNTICAIKAGWTRTFPAVRSPRARSWPSSMPRRRLQKRRKRQMRPRRRNPPNFRRSRPRGAPPLRARPRKATKTESTWMLTEKGNGGSLNDI